MKALSKEYFMYKITNEKVGESMQFGNIKNLGEQSVYPEAIQRALNYLKETDFTNKESGVYEIDGKKLFVQVIDTETGVLEERHPEIHKKYIDVQYSISGNEAIGFVIDDGENEVREDLLQERDLLFYKEVKNENFLKMLPGSFAVFYPTDVHRPNCILGEKMKIRKAIVKVSVDLI